MNRPLISIIIPTHNSAAHLSVLLESIQKQAFRDVEVIVVDNDSKDDTLKVSKKYGAKLIICPGNPPQVARQRNLGAKVARGNYLYFMDHDMELSYGFLNYFAQTVYRSKNSKVDAWYIPEKIISFSKILSIVRNFEAIFIQDTVICAARIIKKTSYLELKGYDEKLSSGPADWDLDLQMKVNNFSFSTFERYVFHHEEKLTVRSYIFKKTTYIKGEEVYKSKWRNNPEAYNDIVKQYSLRYRVFWIFIENEKWKLLLRNLDQYLLFLIIKLSLVIVYVHHRNKYAK